MSIAGRIANLTQEGRPHISALSPSSGPVGTTVTINGSGFGANQGASRVTFIGIQATPTSCSATRIQTSVPTGATTGNVIVTVDGVSSAGAPFAVTTTPCIPLYRVNGSSSSYLEAERHSTLNGTRWMKVTSSIHSGGAYMQIPQGAGSFTIPGTSPDHLRFSLDVTKWWPLLRLAPWQGA